MVVGLLGIVLVIIGEVFILIEGDASKATVVVRTSVVGIISSSSWIKSIFW